MLAANDHTETNLSCIMITSWVIRYSRSLLPLVIDEYLIFKSSYYYVVVQTTVGNFTPSQILNSVVCYNGSGELGKG